MKRFDYATAINQLGLPKSDLLNSNINYDKIPSWAKSSDFLNLFLPYLNIVYDSREQDTWIADYCKFYGISTTRALKDQKAKTENLKEGDYSFSMHFGDKTYDFVGICSYERKGSVAEFYGNCINGRNRIKKEFNRFGIKCYEKVVLVLQFGECLQDLIGMEFKFRQKNSVGKVELINKNTNRTMYSTIMSWKQPNNNDFDVIQSNDKLKLFWSMLQDIFYFFRQEIRLECISKGMIEIL